MELAKRQKVSLSTELDPEHKALLDRLSKLKGADFDREYMQAMVKDHREAVAKFEQEARAGQDPPVKAFAERTLPTLQEHLQLARNTAETAGATAGTK